MGFALQHKRHRETAGPIIYYYNVVTNKRNTAAVRFEEAFHTIFIRSIHDSIRSFLQLHSVAALVPAILTYLILRIR